MKKLFLVLNIAITLFLSNQGNAQGLYCGVGGGYGLGTNKTNDFNDHKNNYGSSANSYETILPDL